MEKLPDVFSQYFLKEGVVFAVDQLAAAQPPAPPAAPKPEAAPGDKGKARRSSGGGRPASRAADKDGGSEGADVRTPAGDTLRAAVGVRARRFNVRYFTDASGKTVGEPPGLGWAGLAACGLWQRVCFVRREGSCPQGLACAPLCRLALTRLLPPSRPLPHRLRDGGRPPAAQHLRAPAGPGGHTRAAGRAGGQQQRLRLHFRAAVQWLRARAQGLPAGGSFAMGLASSRVGLGSE